MRQGLFLTSGGNVFCTWSNVLKMNVLKLLREDNKYHIIAVFDILAQIYIMKHIKGLDTLRAFAVIFVIVAHWGLPFDNSTTMYRILMIMIPEGKFGVNLFFVLSGFL